MTFPIKLKAGSATLSELLPYVAETELYLSVKKKKREITETPRQDAAQRRWDKICYYIYTCMNGTYQSAPTHIHKYLFFNAWGTPDLMEQEVVKTTTYTVELLLWNQCEGLPTCKYLYVFMVRALNDTCWWIFVFINVIAILPVCNKEMHHHV